MSDLLLNLPCWDAEDDRARETVARDAVASLRQSFEFVGLHKNSLGAHCHTTARFQWQGKYFRLLPGSSAVLGYDRTHPHVLSGHAQQQWEETAQEYELELHSYLDSVMTPLRRVDIPPLLVAEQMTDVSYRQYFDELIEIPEIVRRTNPNLPKKFRRYRDVELTLKELTQKFEAEGFRLPTSDEWEYMCAAGSHTLFRWGSDCPHTCYPNETPSTLEERTVWLDSLEESGALACESADWLRSGARVGDFDLHVRPNAFGLSIAQNPYEWETCAGGELRGGDGGYANCGGIGFLIGWLSLAPAYCHPSQPDTARFARRVLSIPV